LVLGLAVWTQWYIALRKSSTYTAVTSPYEALAKELDHPGAVAWMPGSHSHGGPAAEVIPEPLKVAEDREYLRQEGCNTDPEDTDPGFCRVAGSGVETFKLAVVGGSHSSQWLPALEMIAARRGWQVIAFTKSNCPFYLGQIEAAKEVESCRQWNNNVLDSVLRLHPDAVFTTSTRYDYSAADEFVPDGYVSAWSALSAEKIKVIAIRDNPDFEFDVSACVELHGPNAPLCSLPRRQMLEIPSPTDLLDRRPALVRFVDLSDYFCNETTCPPVIGNVLIYRHKNHITATYMRSLAPVLEQALHRALM
jgi:hypothetical protein